MQVKHLDHLNLTVADLEASIDWYARVLGFRVRERGTYQGAPWAIVQSGDALLCMYEHPDFAFEDGGDLDRRRLHSIHHFGLRIADRAAWEETVEREGVHVEYGGVVEWPRSQSWYVLDPTGYEIEVALWNDDEVSFPALTAALEARA